MRRAIALLACSVLALEACSKWSTPQGPVRITLTMLGAAFGPSDGLAQQIQVADVLGPGQQMLRADGFLPAS